MKNVWWARLKFVGSSPASSLYSSREALKPKEEKEKFQWCQYLFFFSHKLKKNTSTLEFLTSLTRTFSTHFKRKNSDFHPLASPKVGGGCVSSIKARLINDAPTTEKRSNVGGVTRDTRELLASGSLTSPVIDKPALKVCVCVCVQLT